MDAATGSCTFCGQTSVHRHHLTGRHPDKTYLHPELVAEMCHRHHVLVHNDLRTLGIDVPNPDENAPVAMAVFALRRIAAFLGRFGDCADNPLWRLLAAVLEATATTIANQTARLGGCHGA